MPNQPEPGAVKREAHAPLNINQLRDFVPRMAFNYFLGFRVERLNSDGVTISCAVRPDILDENGVLHGGVYTTLADAAAGFATQRHLGGRRPITTVELKINHMAETRSGRVRARARLLRVGNTLSIARVDLSGAKGRALGVALVTYMLLPVSSPGGNHLLRE